MTADSTSGPWAELLAKATTLHATHPVGLWWREPTPDLGLNAPLICMGVGWPADIGQWPEPQECWFWCRAAEGDRRALHGVRGSGGSWRWRILAEPEGAREVKTWALGKADARRYGVDLGAALGDGQRLICRQKPAEGWLWFGIYKGVDR